MDSKELTVLVAHCDDEFLFMFPALQKMKVKKIVCVTSDVDNPQRAWCKERKKAFFEICEMVGAKGVCLDYSSRFYALPNKELWNVVTAVRQEIADAEKIFTHNAWGEYGHLDHVMCHQIARMLGRPFLTTGIVLQADWYPVFGYYQGSDLGLDYENAIAFHEKCMNLYRKYSAMGWTYPPVAKANVFEVTP